MRAATPPAVNDTKRVVISKENFTIKVAYIIVLAIDSQLQD